MKEDYVVFQGIIRKYMSCALYNGV